MVNKLGWGNFTQINVKTLTYVSADDKYILTNDLARDIVYAVESFKPFYLRVYTPQNETTNFMYEGCCVKSKEQLADGSIIYVCGLLLSRTAYSQFKDAVRVYVKVNTDGTITLDKNNAYIYII